MQTSRPDLLQLIESSSGADGRRLLSAVHDAAGRQSVSSYLVGGCVRDAILGRRSPDLDLSVEGDARQVARAAAELVAGSRLTTHDAFGTATISLGALHIDLITARREVYPAPGALPSVRSSNIYDDLARRDFTVNAIAVGFSGVRRGELLDPFRGVADIDMGLIRVLHQSSFRDDATRLLRAARYASRYQFSLEQGTRTLAARDVGFLSTISAARVRQEYLRCFAEQSPVAALTLVGRLRLSEALMAGLRYTPAVVAGWRRLSQAEWDDALLPWLMPVLHWDERRLAEYAERFALTSGERHVVRAMPRTRMALTRLARRPHRPSEIAAALDPLPPAALLAWIRSAPASRRGTIAAHYLDELRHVRPQLTPAMLKQLGVREGPVFGKILHAIRAARQDNPALTLDDERRLVQHVVQQEHGA
jgi:tRNA nucleotidyltransferase (CCA-adding enzyme)